MTNVLFGADIFNEATGYITSIASTLVQESSSGCDRKST